MLTPYPPCKCRANASRSEWQRYSQRFQTRVFDKGNHGDMSQPSGRFAKFPVVNAGPHRFQFAKLTEGPRLPASKMRVPQSTPEYPTGSFIQNGPSPSTLWWTPYILRPRASRLLLSVRSTFPICTQKRMAASRTDWQHHTFPEPHRTVVEAATCQMYLPPERMNPKRQTSVTMLIGGVRKPNAIFHLGAPNEMVSTPRHLMAYAHNQKKNRCFSGWTGSGGLWCTQTHTKH